MAKKRVAFWNRRFAGFLFPARSRSGAKREDGAPRLGGSGAVSSAAAGGIFKENALLANLRLHLKRVLSYLEEREIVKNAGRYEVGIFLVANRKLREMKKNFLGEAPKTVDVLAFPEPGSENFAGRGRRREKKSEFLPTGGLFPHPETKKVPLGEIYLNRRLAESDPRRGRFLLRHGLLHLLGYRHNKKSDTIKMQSLEEELNRKYDAGFTIYNRLGYRNRIHKSGGRGK
jgi:ssRNA-specific RNase YbeY (16S rRNA maturation enzyme)